MIVDPISVSVFGNINQTEATTKNKKGVKETMPLTLDMASMVAIERATGVTLSQTERDIFNAEYAKLFSINTVERDLAQIFGDNIQYVYESLLEAKKALKSQSFQGMNANSSALGWQITRPEHLQAGTTAAAAGIQNIIQWSKTITNTVLNAATNGWIDWIGTSTTAKKVRKYAYVVCLGVVNYAASPKSVAIKPKIGGKDLNVFNFETQAKIGTKIFPFAKPFRIPPENDVYITEKVESAGVDELAMLGVTFATGVYLLDTNPITES